MLNTDKRLSYIKIQVISIVLLLIMLSPLVGYTQPQVFEQLKAKFEKIKNLHFKYVEKHTPTSSFVIIDGENIPNNASTTAEVFLELEGKMRVKYRVDRAISNMSVSGDFISDGIHIWSYDKHSNKLGASLRSILKTKVIKQKINIKADKFDQTTCLSFHQPHFVPSSLTTWSLFNFYDELSDQKIIDKSSELDKKKGEHHWSIEGDKGRCGRVDLWIRDADGMLMKFTAYNMHKGFDGRIHYTGQFTDIKVNSKLDQKIFSFDKNEFPNVQVYDSHS